MKETVLKIQSYSDIITNSSSEVFLAKDPSTIGKIEAIIEEVINEFEYDIYMDYSITTMSDEYIEVCQDELEYKIYPYDSIWEFSDIVHKQFWEFINYDETYPFIDARELTLEQYIQLMSLIDGVPLNKNSIKIVLDNNIIADVLDKLEEENLEIIKYYQ